MFSQPLEYTIAGAAGGFASCLITQPLELLKTRAQMQNAASESYSLWTAARFIARNEGVIGFYRGLEAMVIALVPSWAVYFPCYGFFKHSISQLLHCPDTESRVHVSAALCAGCITACTTNPLWVVKTRMQAEGYQGNVIDSLRYLVRQDGVRGLFKGLNASLVGTAHAGIQFPVYERLKLTIAGYQKKEQCGTLDLLAASSLSKLVATIITYPHQVLRTRLHMTGVEPSLVSSRITITTSTLPSGRPPGLLQLTKEIMHKEGWRAMYNGMLANTMQVVPACAVTFTTFELMLRWLSTLRKKSQAELV